MDAAALKQLVLSQGVINGKYKDVALLSEDGAFSIVFKATVVRNGRRAALKFFLESRDPRRLAYFEREGKLLNGPLKGEQRIVQLLDDPAILQVPVTAASTTFSVELPYLVLEWMDGGSASSLCRKPPHDRLSLLDRLECFREMVRCVRRLHGLSCYHRDLKPENFLLRHSPSARIVKLSDLGTARMLGSGPALQPDYTLPLGDLRYAAPELVSGVDVPHDWLGAADIYALGAILFELCTGQELIAWTFGDAREIGRFLQLMLNVPETKRLDVFHGFISSRRAPLPSLQHVNPLLPKCGLDRLSHLVIEMTNPDYRQRGIQFNSIMNQLDIMRLMLRNEAKFLARLARRRGRP